MSGQLNDKVRSYWEREPCGSSRTITADSPRMSLSWFERIEDSRYEVEPFIHSVAQFTRYHGKKILEIGVGAGTDHLQWARAGAQCYGVDLTDAAIEITRARLLMYGFESNLQRVDAEVLPFPDESFDLVYSWGVIHHSAHPERIIKEIKRVLKPGGKYIGMMYNRHSIAALKLWVRYGLLKGKPLRRFADVIWHDLESVGTKAYSVSELNELFSSFNSLLLKPVITSSDIGRWTAWLNNYFPDQWGWFITIEVTK